MKTQREETAGEANETFDIQLQLPTGAKHGGRDGVALLFRGLVTYQSSLVEETHACLAKDDFPDQRLEEALTLLDDVGSVGKILLSLMNCPDLDLC